MEEKTFLKLIVNKANAIYMIIGTTVTIFPAILKQSIEILIIGLLLSFVLTILYNFKILFYDLQKCKSQLNEQQNVNNDMDREKKQLEKKYRETTKAYQSTLSEINTYKMVIHVVRSEVYGTSEFKSLEANKIVSKLKYAIENVNEGDDKNGI